jgi:hypothetical protein
LFIRNDEKIKFSGSYKWLAESAKRWQDRFLFAGDSHNRNTGKRNKFKSDVSHSEHGGVKVHYQAN